MGRTTGPLPVAARLPGLEQAPPSARGGEGEMGVRHRVPPCSQLEGGSLRPVPLRCALCPVCIPAEIDAVLGAAGAAAVEEHLATTIELG